MTEQQQQPPLSSIIHLGFQRLFRLLKWLPAVREMQIKTTKRYHLMPVRMAMTKKTKDRVLAFPGGSDGKESACYAGDLGSIPGLEKSSGEENSYPFQYSCLINPMNRGAWWDTVHGATKSQTRLGD